jgi:hypothetical protein
VAGNDGRGCVTRFFLAACSGVRRFWWWKYTTGTRYVMIPAYGYRSRANFAVHSLMVLLSPSDTNEWHTS